MLTMNSLETSRRPAILGYAVAVLSIAAAAIGLELMQAEWQASIPVGLFLVAVVVSTWFGGTKPGLFALALSVLAFSYLFLRPVDSSAVEPPQVVRLISFVVVACLVIWITGTARNATESLRRTLVELRRNNETLRESERKLKEAEQLGKIGYWERDLIADRITWSDETSRILGRPSQSGFSKAEFDEMIHPDDRYLPEQKLTEALQGGGAYDVEFRMVRPDGEVRFVHVRDEITYDGSGRPIRMFGAVQDVTERKRAEESLRERETLFEVLTENAYDLIRLHEVDGGSIYASRAVVQLLGKKPVNEFDDIHPEDLENGRHWWQHILTGGRDRIEWRVHDAAGGCHWVESRGSVVQYEGKPRVITVCRDISERKRAEQALRKSERVLREAEELGHTGSWEYDLVTGEIFNTDENLRLFFGDDRSKGARIGDYLDAVHPDDRAIVLAQREQLLAEGGPRDIEFRVVWPDGGFHVLFGRATVVRNDLGEAVRVYGTNVDITERARAEEGMRENQQLLQLVLATLPVGVFVTDRAGDIVLANAASKRIWGDITVSGRERWAQSKGFWHDSGKRIAPTEWASVRALADGKMSVNELIDIETHSGQQKTMQNSAAPIRNAEGLIVGTVIVNEDVTERVRAEEALRESAHRLQYLSRRLLTVQEEERRHLSRELHDEFGQLLATITVQLHAAKSVAGDVAQSILEECMALLQRAGAQVRSLALELRPTMLETAGLDSTLRWLAEQHQQHTGIATEVVGHLNDVPGDVAIACFRAAQEALTNVVRHARAQHVWIELSQRDDVVELVVRDDGVGFDVAGTLERADRRGRLGLLGIKERVQILGGDLEVKSKPGQGTRVCISLPLSEPVPEAAEPLA